MDKSSDDPYDEHTQMLAYLAVRMAKLDAMLSTALPALVVASQGGSLDDSASEADIAVADDFARMHAAIANKNLHFLYEQFPRIARSMKYLTLLNEKDIQSAASDLVDSENH